MNTHNRSYTATITVLLVLLVVFAVACGRTQPTTKGDYTPPSTFAPDKDLGAQHFNSEAEFSAFLNSAGSSSYGGGIAAMREGGVASDVMMASKAGAAAPAATVQGTTPSHSDTNNQVAGVDEADIIKTDGNYIYTITGNTLFIVKAYPGEDAELVKTIEFKSQPTGLFVSGDHLAVFGYFYDIDYFKSVGFVPRNGMTFFTIYDISDKQNPAVLKDYKFEGNYLDARMTDGYVYFAATTTPYGRDPLPVLFEGTAKRTMPVSDIYYYPIPYDSVQLLTVQSINLDDPDAAISSKALAVQWDNKLYMSDKNIYITTTQNINQWEIQQDVAQEILEQQLTQADKDLIAKIKAVDDEVLSPQEKKSKIQQVYSLYLQYSTNSDEQQALQEQIDEETAKRMEQYEALTYTVINRISADHGTLRVEATGKVPGTVLNQFSMDEYNGVFRIATTIQPFWNWIRPMMAVDAVSAPGAVGEPAPSVAVKAAPDSVASVDDVAPAKMVPQRTTPTNNVYTLDMNLDVLGKLKDIAPGETIQSARYMGERLYLVTFRQVDPFFAIDLSDAAHPKILGKLKVPGFSRYLHPYDDHTIIGIGRDATALGSQQGLKISLFDVTDVEHPKEVAKFVTNDQYAQSVAEWEHKAFLFDKDKQLLVIPAYSYNYDYRTGASRQNYNGAMVFKVTPTEITLRGIIDHSQGSTQQYYSPTVERSLWIDDLLYTKSPTLLRINKISDLSKVKNVELTSANAGPYPVY